MQELVGTAMDNLALAAVTKQTTLDILAQSNTTLVKVNAEQQHTIAKLTNKITTLEKKLEQSSVGGGGGSASEKFDPNMYCWSHEYINYPNHNSATCRNKKEGHKCEATRQNTMGGSIWNAGIGNAPNRA